MNVANWIVGGGILIVIGYLLHLGREFQRCSATHTKHGGCVLKPGHHLKPHTNKWGRTWW